jgi:hypothetical protein
MTHQRRLHIQQDTDRASKTQIIEAQRNTITVGVNDGVAMITVRDYHLRTVYAQINIDSIEQLISELQETRDCLIRSAG